MVAALLLTALVADGCASAGPTRREEGEAGGPDAVGGARFGSLPTATHPSGLTVAAEHADYLRPVSGATPVHIVIHNGGERPLLVRAAEIILDLGDERRVRALSVEELERMESERATLPAAAVVVPTPPDAAAQVTEPETSRTSRALEYGKDAAMLAVLLTAWWLWEGVKPLAVAVAGTTLPIWGPFYFSHLFREDARRLRAEQLERERRTADTSLRRLEMVRLEKDETASAILDFDVELATVDTFVLVVPFIDASDQAQLVHLPIARR